jgi:SNF2 family DNA or RNA helicase
MELLDYQQKVLDFLSHPKNRHVLVVHGTGCGKTTLACYITKEFLEKQIVQSVQIVAPVTIHGQVTETLEKLNVKNWNVSILSYNSFLHDVDSTNSLLIVDEAHNLRTKKGKMAKRCIKSCSQAVKVLLMTATPFVNNSNDLMNLVKMCFPQTIDTRVPLIRHLQSLNIFFKERPLSEDYPTFEVNKVGIRMTKEEKVNYEKFLKKQQLESFDVEIYDRIGKLGNTFMIHTNGMRRVGDSGIFAKLKYLEETLDKYDKQIIFSSWTKAGLGQIAEILNSKKIPYGIITGAIDKKKRTEYVKQYNSNEINMLIFSKAGGEGIDLKGTRRVVILEPGWNVVVEQQAMHRAIRYKSHSHLPVDQRHVLVEKLFIENDVSTDKILLREYIEKKEEEANALMATLQSLSL